MHDKKKSKHFDVTGEIWPAAWRHQANGPPAVRPKGAARYRRAHCYPSLARVHFAGLRRKKFLSPSRHLLCAPSEKPCVLAHQPSAP